MPSATEGMGRTFSTFARALLDTTREFDLSAASMRRMAQTRAAAASSLEMVYRELDPSV
jgi:hypothetical protein